MTEKNIRLISWFSKFERSFDPGDLHGSLAGIVALFDSTHNISAEAVSGPAETLANQMSLPNNEPCIGV
jgi:hypothetical protein